MLLNLEVTASMPAMVAALQWERNAKLLVYSCGPKLVVPADAIIVDRGLSSRGCIRTRGCTCAYEKAQRRKATGLPVPYCSMQVKRLRNSEWMCLREFSCLVCTSAQDSICEADIMCKLGTRKLANEMQCGAEPEMGHRERKTGCAGGKPARWKL